MFRSEFAAKMETAIDYNLSYAASHFAMLHY